MQRDIYQELVWQLSRLPGGTAAAIPDFFGHLLAEPVTDTDTRWRFMAGGQLELETDGALVCGSAAIAQLPPALLAAAREAGLSPILLGLLALASGDLDGDHRLKAVLPRVDGAAKDLMLMTICRLCG